MQGKWRGNDEPENLVRLVAQLEVEPAELAVVPAHDQMISGGMHVQRRDPFESG